MSAKKTLTVYRCTACGHVEPKWLGRCPECGRVEHPPRDGRRPRRAPTAAGETFPLPIASIDPGRGRRASRRARARWTGSWAAGSCGARPILLGGEPGIGKSTLLLQLCAKAETQGTHPLRLGRGVARPDQAPGRPARAPARGARGLLLGRASRLDPRRPRRA